MLSFFFEHGCGMRGNTSNWTGREGGREGAGLRISGMVG